MRRKRVRKQHRCRPTLESLESRRLLTVIIDPHYLLPYRDDSVTISAGDQARIDLLANDKLLRNYQPVVEWINTANLTYRSDPAPDHLPQVDSVNDAQAGSHELLSDRQTLIYSPDEGFTGIDQFTYLATDSSGKSYEATITINVVDPIVAIPDWFRVDQGDQDIVLDVIQNDGSNISQSFNVWDEVLVDTLTITAASSSGGGTVTVSESGDVLIYTPAADFSGLETLTYSVASPDGYTATTFVDVRVTSADDHDTRGWTEWWKHQTIHASLHSNGRFGQVGGIGEFSALHHRSSIGLSGLPDLTWNNAWFIEDDADFTQEFASSSTNVQVVGVDQGDLVKTDGRYIYVVTQGGGTGASMTIFDAVDPNLLPLVSRVPVEGTPLELHLTGESILLVSQSSSGVRVDSIEIADRSAPDIQQYSIIPGRFQESRMVNGVVQIYTTLLPYVPIEPVCVNQHANACFRETRGQLVDRILSDPKLYQAPSVNTFAPTGNTPTSVAEPIESRTLAPHARLVDTPSLLVATFFDVSGPHAQQVIGSGDAAQIYVSPNNVFVFNTQHNPPAALQNGEIFVASFPPSLLRTTVNQFELASDGRGLTWSAQGTVDGQLLNSFSVGQHEQSLHVAVTGIDLANAVVVLQQDGQSLVTVGRTEPFATGEQIYAARFVEDKAYVVTFLQVDPLFVIDLSDPTSPTVTGELVMPDYSQYLHPVGDDFLIGVGRDTDDWGFAEGMQVSLFDVRDPKNPMLSDKRFLKVPSSPLAEGPRALSDHRAFNYFASHQILALPYDAMGARTNASGVLLLHIDAETGIQQVGDIRFAGSRVTRTLRMGDVIYSVSDTEIQAHDLTNPSECLIQQSIDGSPILKPTKTVPPDLPVVDPDLEPLETAIRITPHFVDDNGESVDMIETGQTVWLEVTAADVRWLRQTGVFSAYFDIDFGDAEVEIVGDSVFSDAFWVRRLDPADQGWQNVGATQGLQSQVDPSRPWVFRVPIQFVSQSQNQREQVTVRLSPSDNPGFEHLLYGVDHTIPATAIEADSATITVTQNASNQQASDPMDVNQDGKVSLIDPLNVINRLTQRSESPEARIDISPYDVNGDGQMSFNDVIILINYIANERAQDQAIAEMMDDEDKSEELSLETTSVLF